MFCQKCKKMDEWSIRRKFIFMLSFIVGMGLIGYLLLVFVYLIPAEYMQKNMIRSARVFEKSTYPQLMGTRNSQLDNWTDALMLLNASHVEESESVFEQAINVKRYKVPDNNPHQTLINIYEDSGTEYIELSYARYWHGYLIFLKPLLALFDYGTIRYILMFFQLGIFVILIVNLVMVNKRIAISTFLMWLFLNPAATMISLQFSTITDITLLAMLGIILGDKHLKNCKFVWNIYFCAIGGLTSYFDLLTYPLVCLGVPLTLWLFFNCSKNAGGYKQCLTKSIFWAIGYLGMWSSKWILGSVISHTNVIEDALKAIHTDSIGDTAVSAIETIQRNLSASTPLIECIVISEIVLLLVSIVKFKRISWKTIYFIICLYPFMWYLVATNHSFIHFWFTYRNLAVSVYAFAVWTVAAFTE